MSSVSSVLRPHSKETGQSSVARLPELSIRALNNDNHLDAKKLVELFRAHYGDSHPFRKVYDPSFWCHSKRSRLEPGGLISLVAEEGNRFIGHLALDKNPLNGAVQLMLPAILPRYKSSVFSIIRSFWLVIERQAVRQNWRLIFCYNPSTQPLMQLLAAKCFHAEATALMPATHVSYGFDRDETVADPHSMLLVMCNVLDPHDAEDTVLYPPAAHLEEIRRIYSSVGLAKTFHDLSISPPPPEPRKTSKKWEKRKGFFVRHLKRFGIFQLRIMPSALSSQEGTHALIDRIESRRAERQHRLGIQIALDDPRCPEFCAELERRGYRFCGVMPLIAMHDYIVYAKYEDYEIKRLTLYTDASKALREYMLQNTRIN